MDDAAIFISFQDDLFIFPLFLWPLLCCRRFFIYYCFCQSRREGPQLFVRNPAHAIILPAALSLSKKNSFSLPLRSAIERQESTGIWLNRGPDWSVLTSSWHRLRLISYLPVKHGTHTHVSVWLLTGRLWRRFLVRRLAHLNVSGQQPSQRVCHGTTRWLYSSLLHPE